MADETLEDFRKRETDTLVRRRFEVAETLYEKVMTTGDPRLAKAYLEVTGPMVKETEKVDPLAGLPRVEISIHYGSMTLTASASPGAQPAPSPLPLADVVDMEEAPPPPTAALPSPDGDEAEPDLDPLPTYVPAAQAPTPAPERQTDALIDAATLARLLEE